MEEIRLEEDLTVGDGDDVGRDVGRQVPGLRLDDRQRRERTAAVVGVQLRCALEEPRVQVEDVSRERLPPRRAAQQQRDFTVRLRVLRQVVVDAECVAAAVAEELTERAGGVGADVEQRRGVGSGRRDHHRVIHGTLVLERLDHLRDGRLLLADGVVDADDVQTLLIDDGVDRHRRLAGLPVADDQLALSTANGNHRVDRLESGLQRLLDRLAVDDARRDAFDRRLLLGGDRALAVQWLPERVDHSAEHRVADRNGHDAPGPLYGVAFLDLGRFAEQHRTYAVFLEVQRDAEDAVRELEHLGGHRAVDPVQPRDAVPHRHDRADFRDIDVECVVPELFLDDPGDLVCFYCHRPCAAVHAVMKRCLRRAR